MHQHRRLLTLKYLTQVDTVPTTSRSEQEPPVEEGQVSSHSKVKSNTTDV